tara:strand:+ start:3331 stop:3861 length:531 start_codon:yes stop_codon:yes gene_type:complete
MPPFNPSDALVSVRLRALIRRDGIAGVARSYGVQERTVRRWNQGGNPNTAARRSIVRRGLPLTGAVVQDPSGGFSTSTTLYRPEAIAFQRAETERRRVRQQRAIETAQTPAEMQDAIAQSESSYQVSTAEAVDFDNRLRRLQEYSDRGGDWSDFEEYWGYEDDWDSFRSAYEQMAG